MPPKSGQKKIGEAVEHSLEIVNEAQRRSFLASRKVPVDSRTPIQLDIFFPTLKHENERFLPNDYARSALFTVRNKNSPRRAMTGQVLYHLHETVSITYTGIELRASDDELVFLQILHYGAKVPLGEPFEFTIAQLVADIGWAKNGTYYDKARDCISRLKATEIKISNDKAFGRSLGKSLIADYETENDIKGKANKYRVWVDKKLIYLMAGETFTNHPWIRYRNYSPIARRLADYAASHQQPYPLSVEAFKRMCDSECKTLTKWIQQVRAACAEIVAGGDAKQATVRKRKDSGYFIHIVR